MLKNILTPLLKSAFDDPRSPLHQRNPSNCSIPETVDDDSIAEDFAYDVRVEIIRRTVEQLKSTSDMTAHRDVSVVGTRHVLRKYPCIPKSTDKEYLSMCDRIWNRSMRYCSRMIE